MKNELEGRTLQFALKANTFVDSLPRNTVGTVIGRQLLRSATSVGANYREAQSAESKADFIHKVAVAEKEAAETEYWLILCLESKLAATEATKLLTESRELLAILVTIGRNAKRNQK
ncbi:MAG: four helix bundle protein [bacterium]|nr:four helix bundle protein [bacterium]MDI1334730.1 four helix bundle protein [Lacunisphaera sp.]